MTKASFNIATDHTHHAKPLATKAAAKTALKKKERVGSRRDTLKGALKLPCTNSKDYDAGNPAHNPLADVDPTANGGLSRKAGDGGGFFPQPGLAAELFRAMENELNNDLKVMKAYNTLQETQYKDMATQWDKFAESDFQTLKKQGLGQILSGAGSALGVIGTAVCAGMSARNFAKGTAAIEGPTDEIKTLKGTLMDGDGATGRSSVASRADSTGFDSDTIRGNTRNGAEPLPLASRKALLDKEYGEKLESISSDGGALNETHRDTVKQKYNEEKTLLEKENAKVKRQIDEKEAELDKAKRTDTKDGEKWRNYSMMGSTIGQAAAPTAGGIVAMDAAQYQQNKDMADKAKSLDQQNYSVVDRQWGNLAQNIENVLSQVQQSITSYFSAMRG